MATSFLPRLSIANLKKRAKSLLKRHRGREPDVCQVLRHLHRFAHATNEQILAGDVKLSEVQFALAKVHGFHSWQDLIKAVESQPDPGVTNKASMPALELAGDGHQQDSHSLVMSAVAKAVGRELDYETAHVLSTNAFALGIVRGEGKECPAWWHMDGRHHGIDIVAARTGLACQPLDLPPVTAEEWSNDARQAERRRRCAGMLRQVLAAGRMVVTAGGWDWKWRLPFLTPHAWWGVILEAQPDGTIRGACLNGRTDNPLALLVQNCWSVGPGEVTCTRQEAHQRMLGRALARIRGDHEPFRPDASPWKPVFGLAAVDVWIEQFGHVPFCADCGDRSHRCARSTAMVVLQGALSVSSYMRKHLEGFPPQSRRSIESVAARYDRIAAVLLPFVEGAGGEGYQSILGDASRQRIHARKVIGAVRDELSSVAGDIESAIEAARAGPEANTRPSRSNV